MRRSLVLIGCAALLMGGCNQKSTAPSNTNSAEPAAGPTTAALPAAAPATPIGIKPGRWENTSEVLDAQGQGIPAQALAMMKGQPHTVTTCVSPEQAKMGVRELMQSSGQSHCDFDKYEFGGGKLSTEMRCTMPHGTMVNKATGTYTDTSYDVLGEGTMSAQMREPMTMTMKTRNSGHWVGECTGEEKAK